ncbi:Cytosol aminopeptidase [subsurface metagenome]
MKIKILNQSITNFHGDIIIVNLFEGIKLPGGATGAVDKALDGMITKLIKNKEITGKLGEGVVLHTFGKIKPDKVLIVGLGKSSEFGLEQIRKASGAAAKQARKTKAKKVGTVVHGAGIRGLEPGAAAQALIEGTLLALYEFKEYKKPEQSNIEEFSVVEMDKQKNKSFQKGIETGKILAESQNIARDLINEPSNNLTPKKLDQRIKSIIKNAGLEKIIGYNCLNKTDIKKLKMGALISVAQGSDNEPKFIILRIKNPKKPLICLIGKTVTFDSGGISLKPSANMGLMKGDMSGGASVIGTTLALAKARTKLNLMTIIPAVENMPSAKASRPGDVVRAMNNKTIEIISTDAEGRMTLADAICYAEKKKAKIIIDIATLTGGCIVALGDIAGAIMGNDQKLIDNLLSVSKNTGEKFWQLPLFEEYKEQIKTDVADIKNSGGRKASAITAGLFLQSFVKNSKWLHIDIAGKEIAEKESFYTPKGGTGFGVRTLFEFLWRLDKKSF